MAAREALAIFGLRIGFGEQREKLFGVSPRLAGDAGHCLKSVGRRRSRGWRCRFEEARAPVVVSHGGECGNEGGQSVQVRQGRGLGAVKRVQKHLAPSASHGVYQVWGVAGGNAKTQRIAGDRLAVDKSGGCEG